MNGREEQGSPISMQMGEAVIVRLVSLERELKALQRSNALLLAALIASLLLGVGAIASSIVMRGRTHTLQAREILLKDANGLTRASWRVDESDEVALALNDPNGVMRLRVSVLRDGGPGIVLMDRNRRSRIVLALNNDTGTLAFADDEETTRAVLGLGTDRAATLVFVDGQGTARAGLGVDESGAPTWTFIERPGSGGPAPDGRQ
jgi:hypothetical protein